MNSQIAFRLINRHRNGIFCYHSYFIVANVLMDELKIASIGFNSRIERDI